MPMKRAAERIGVFGGTFDPPHIGHVRVAMDVANALELDRLLWIPARRSPLKSHGPATPDPVRLEMVRAAASEDPRFEVDTRELERPPPSYTVHTLEELRRELGPEVRLFLILGFDQYRLFARWHEPDRIRRLATVVVIDRDGHGLEDGSDALTVPVRRVDVSATEVRARAARGESVEDDVPAGVAAIIERERLYT